MKIIKLLALVFILASCSNSDFEGYQKIENSLHYKRVALGDDQKKIDETSSVSLEFKCIDNDSIIGIKRIEELTIAGNTLPKYFNEIMSKSFEGDSIAFIGVAKDFQLKSWFDLPIKNSDTIEIYLSVTKVLSDQELRNHRAEERLKSDEEMFEQQALANILDSLEMDRDHFVNGIYYKLVTRGKGEKAQSGDHVRVNYISRLYNGAIVDNTYQGKSLEYEIGRPDQVIPGFSIGMALMREGGEAIFVIPSQLAFGEIGSSSGLVPPYHTVIYEVKLEKVRM